MQEMEDEEVDTSPFGYWQFYEKTAWKASAEADEVPADVLDDIKSRWEALDNERQHEIFETIKQCSDCAEELKELQKYVDESGENYQGHDDDHDEYGEEDPTRPTFSAYKENEEALLSGMKNYRAALQKLITVIDDGKLKTYAQDLVSDSDDTVQRIMDRIRDELPALEVSARQKLAERERKALGELGLGWVGSWPVGAGASAAPKVWVKQNGSGVIVDRVVIKDTQLTSWNWSYFGNWTQGGRSGKFKVPSEIQALYNLRGLIGSNSIIKIRNWRMQSRKHQHRQYLEYCPYGDLFGLVSGQEGDYSYGFQVRRHRRFMEQDVRAYSRFIPEPFIWYCFLQLARAGLLMERGELDRHGMLPWNQIVHRDIKWQNIFLGPNSHEEFPGYLQPKLADFGLCLILPPDDQTPPHQYSSAGTPGSFAPEQYHVLQQADGTTTRLGSKTNVWGVGLVMWSLVTCDEHSLVEHFDFGVDNGNRRDDDPRRVPAPFDASAKIHYSKALLDLIRRCTAFRDTDRPSFDEVLAEIDKHTIGEHDRANGMRSSKADPKKFKFAAEGHSNGLPTWLEDKWAIGAEFRALFAQSTLQQDENGQGQNVAAPEPPSEEPPDTFDEDYGGNPGAEIQPQSERSIPPIQVKPLRKRKSSADAEGGALKRRSQSSGNN